jgi:hypothetical protein
MQGWTGLGNLGAPLRREFPHPMNGLGPLAGWEMLYYNIRMSDHDHSHHHHHAGHAHPPVSAHPSILRLSVLERLALAAVAIAVLWLAAFWAMR